MSPAQVDSFIKEHSAAETPPGVDGEYRVVRGDFVATVQPHADTYSFAVRDTRRERPTIHGFGVDFPHAVVAITELLDALTGKR
jgi:hypothetical protein